MAKRKRSNGDTPDRPARVDPVLYGQSGLLNIVAVQQVGESSMRLYSRTPEAGRAGVLTTVTFIDTDFFPFFFLSHPALIEGFARRHWLKELAGTNYYRYLVAFGRWHDLWEAVRFCLNNHNKTALRKANHYSEVEPLFLRPDPLTQYLLHSGVTLFKGMEFEQLHRMQVSLVVHSKSGKKSDPRRSEDRILALVLADNRGWEAVFDGRKLSEEEILKRFCAAIAERDPDIIEGHELVDHLLPTIARRAEISSVSLPLGRSDTELRSFSPRGNPLEPDLESAIFEVPGRHLIDTKVQALAFSISRRALDQYGLRYLARQIGSSPGGAESVPQEKVALAWAQDPEMLLKVLRDDCRDIRAISDHLSRSSFFKTQMVPLSFDTLSRSGSASKIELLMLREYIRQKHSVPKPQSGTQKSGGYTDIFVTGIIDNVLHADIESLYPSIMITQKIQPATDQRNIFLQLLTALTAARLNAKHSMKSSHTVEDRQRLDSFQSSLKILINSFYGYLAYPRGLFNDYEQADRITGIGQQLLRTIIHEMDLHNATVIEADTDGVYFVPPDNVRNEEQEIAFVQRLSESLPAGIELVLAGRFKRMLSYRKKNYALLDHQDRLTVKGSSLISRTLEPFAKRYIQLCVGYLLQDNVRSIHQLYVSLSRDISEHRLDVTDFCRTETVRDSLETYERELAAGERKSTPAYEVAKRFGVPLRPGDRVSYYITGQQAGVKLIDSVKLAAEWEPNFPDENTAYYLDRLNECSKKFELFFERDAFGQVFAPEDLFGFDPSAIRILKQKAVPKEEGPGTEDAAEFGIWLDEPGPP